jgi:CHAT domain-containing protein
LLYQIPIESHLLLDNDLQNKATKTFRMSSTRWLAFEEEKAESHDAVVYGGLAYGMSIKEMEEDSKIYPKARGIDESQDTHRKAIGRIKDLPGTKTEAEEITQTINVQSRKDFHAQLFTDSQGTEASFKNLDGQHKKVIHIATHGFYYEAAEGAPEDALSRSGLYMAGANNVYQGELLPSDIEDGVLTAKEIAALDFKGLDLVVLSACETGMGKITSDGVFGLQRSFKKAGANSIIMSLWKVDDAATSLLMTEFYKNWMYGNSKHDALEMAKQAVRNNNEWKDPQYWSAFILLDGLD